MKETCCVILQPEVFTFLSFSTKSIDFQCIVQNYVCSVISKNILLYILPINIYIMLFNDVHQTYMIKIMEVETCEKCHIILYGNLTSSLVAPMDV